RFLQQYREHKGAVTALAALADSAGTFQFISGGKDQSVKLWEVRDGMVIDVSTLYHHKAPVMAITALPDGTIVSGSADGAIKVWHAQRGSSDKLCDDHASSIVALGPWERNRFVVLYADRQLGLFSLGNNPSTLAQTPDDLKISAPSPADLTCVATC